jgi:hypothetical protein
MDAPSLALFRCLLTPPRPAIGILIASRLHFRHPLEYRSVVFAVGIESRAAARLPGGNHKKDYAMKTLLALVTLAITALILEDKARQVAGDAQNAYGEAVAQGREATRALSRQVEQQPIVSLLVAGVVAYALAAVIPSRD